MGQNKISLDDMTFGRKVVRSEAIDRVIEYEQLNMALQEKLRERFSVNRDKINQSIFKRGIKSSNEDNKSVSGMHYSNEQADDQISYLASMK